MQIHLENYVFYSKYQSMDTTNNSFFINVHK